MGASLREKPAGDGAAGSTAKATVAATGRWSDHLKSDTDSFEYSRALFAGDQDPIRSTRARVFFRSVWALLRLSNLYVGGKSFCFLISGEGVPLSPGVI